MASDQGLLPGITEKAHYKQAQRPADVPDDAYLEGSRLRIGTIQIRAENIFNTNKSENDTKLFRLGNRLHIKTREETISKQLLFKSGDYYNGRELAESERLLRNRNYLFDARIRPVRVHQGKVDIEVSTQDVWTFKPGISLSRSGGKNTSAFELEEINLLGLGSLLRLSNKTSVDRDSLSIAFRDPNLGSSWWDFSIGYSDNSDGNSNAFGLDHPFYSLDTRQAGGVSWSEFNRINSRYDLGIITEQFFIKEKDAQVFYGWSSGYEDGWTNRYRAGLTYDQREFSPVEGSRGTINLPEDRKLVYPWLSYERLQDDFRKDHNRNQINRTEDINLGWRMTALLGLSLKDLGADRQSVIYKSSIRKGAQFGDYKTLLWSTSLSGRYEESDWEDILLSAQIQYHFHYSQQRLLYFALGANTSENLDADSQLLLGGDSGLRGYPLRFQAGESRWLATVEQRFFTHWYPFRLFNVGAALFADAGEVSGDNVNGSHPVGILKDIGFGIRIGNARSGLGSVVHFDFAFPLDGDGAVDDFQFLIKTKNSF